MRARLTRSRSRKYGTRRRRRSRSSSPAPSTGAYVSGTSERRPRRESDPRTWIRSPLLYPLSYGVYVLIIASGTEVLFHRRRRPARCVQMQTCTRCGGTKPLDQFPPVRRGEPRRQTWCRACFAQANRRNYYYRNHEREKARLVQQVERRRNENQHEMIAYLLDHPCVDCGETDIVVLEFDHVGPKKADVSTLANGGSSWARVMKEIAQCEVRCASCHRRKTAKRRSERTRKRHGESSTNRRRRCAGQLPIAIASQTRRCHVCGETKALAEFPLRSADRQTHRWICLLCQRDYARRWYARRVGRSVRGAFACEERVIELN